MYADGEGVPRNYVEACKWVSPSTALGDPGEWDEQRIESLDSLGSRMTPAQITEVQRLAAEWWEGYRKT